MLCCELLGRGMGPRNAEPFEAANSSASRLGEPLTDSEPMRGEPLGLGLEELRARASFSSLGRSTDSRRGLEEPERVDDLLKEVGF